MADIQTEAFLTGCSLQSLAAYGGFSRSSFAEKVATGKLSSDEEARVQEILTVMKAVRHETGFPIDWSQAAVVKPKLEERIQKYREERNPAPVYVYVVRLTSYSYFRCVRNNEIISTPSLGNCFMCEDAGTAQQLIDALKKNFNVKTMYESFTNTVRRRQDTMCTDLATVGINE
jgi:hypothetical protein